MKNIKIALSFLLVVITLLANAQKLPNKQELSLRIPTNLKIDGNATEFNEQYQAYNNSTEVYYTIANDDENLYLLAHAVKPRIIQKILSVGITFTVNKSGNKNNKAKDNMVITYPVLGVSTGEAVLSSLNIKSINIIKGFNDTAANNLSFKAHKDSLIRNANKLLVNNSKTIKVKGITEIADTIISIHNEQRILSSSAFDSNGEYTYELRIPLKQLGISIANIPKFSYNIKLLSRLDDFKKGFMIVYRYDKNGEQYDMNQDLDSTTDFWGEYTLAKK